VNRPFERLIDSAETAAFLKIHPKLFRRWCAMGNDAPKAVLYSSTRTNDNLAVSLRSVGLDFVPSEVTEDENRKSYATQDAYEGYLTKWILPRWQSYRLPDMKLVSGRGVDEVARSLTGQRVKIRNIISALCTVMRPAGNGLLAIPSPR